MNSFGRIFRLNIFGESHGPLTGITLDGVPAGLELTANDFTEDIQRRKGGNKGTTPRVEDDAPEIVSGWFNEHTTGAPLTILFANANTRPADYEKQRDIPRPGHADLVAAQKFRGFNDHRGGGHFSGRLTVCLVAAGVVAKAILKKLVPKLSITAQLIELAGEKDTGAGLQKAIDNKDSVGGIVQCKANGLPAGLGEPFFDSMESLLSHIVFAIPAIKGIEFGAGFNHAAMFGSMANDAIHNAAGQTETNNSGGINGGISNGNELDFRVVVKPASSTPKPQVSYNSSTGEQEEFSVRGRHDLAIALRVPVVLEAVTACVLADLLLIKKTQD